MQDIHSAKSQRTLNLVVREMHVQSQEFGSLQVLSGW